MTSICIIACYFGNLPEYYKFWYNSCKNNKTINFIFVTDQMDSTTDQNIKIINMNIEQLEKLARKKLSMNNIWLKKPYKICDFRPAFGNIFEDYLKEYDFWGHCDIDQIFGNVREFITEKLLKENDRILKNGNLSLYRNNNKINNLYKEKGSIYSYKKVFTTKENYAFDEFTGINRIIKKNKINCYYKNFFADIDPKYTRFKLVDGENFKNQVFYYKNGEVYRAYIDDDFNIKEDKYSHIHFQKRKMSINDKKIENEFYITKDGFILKDKAVSYDEIIKYSNYISKKQDSEDKKEYLINKINTFVNYPIKQKMVWLKQKVRWE